jgi:hypothetical protein
MSLSEPTDRINDDKFATDIPLRNRQSGFVRHDHSGALQTTSISYPSGSMMKAAK